MVDSWHNQVRLLLAVLPEIGHADGFALHGGTAINLFVQDMPRLSVDIDLTWTAIDDRKRSLSAINAALGAICRPLQAHIPGVSVQHQTQQCKLLVTTAQALVKVEVNTTARGLWGATRTLPLCTAAQTQFDAYCAVPVVSHAQLYGSKLCAALDRQHPRDLFDVKQLLDREGLSDAVRSGLMLALIGSNRPTHELLAPHLLDQRTVFDNRFVGLTTREFSYADFEATRLKLVRTVRASLTKADKAFLFGVNQLQPDWDIYPFADFPAVRWKLRNLQQFRTTKPQAWKQQLEQLEGVLVPADKI